MRAGIVGGFVVALAPWASAQDLPADRASRSPPTRDERDDGLEALGEEVARLQGRLAELETTARRVEEPSLLDAARSVRVSGFVDAAYVWNLADPPGRKGVNAGRLADPDHDTVGVPAASLTLSREVSGCDELDAGFRLELAVGRLVEEALASDGLFDDGPLDLPQAYAALQLPTGWRPLLLEAGRKYSFLGSETLDLSKNACLSLSPLATYGPKTLTGLSLGIDLGAGLRYTQWVGNGWDQVIDENDAKTLGGQLLWRPGERLFASVAWLAGAERPDSANDTRWTVQAELGGSPWTGLTLRGAVQIGEEKGAAVGGGLARWFGATATARQAFFEGEGGGWHYLAVAVRGSYFRDDGGARTGEDQRLVEATATLELRPIEFAALRFEYRHDASSENVFAGQRGAFERDRQDTFALEVRVTF